MGISGDGDRGPRAVDGPGREVPHGGERGDGGVGDARGPGRGGGADAWSCRPRWWPPAPGRCRWGWGWSTTTVTFVALFQAAADRGLGGHGEGGEACRARGGGGGEAPRRRSRAGNQATAPASRTTDHDARRPGGASPAPRPRVVARRREPGLVRVGVRGSAAWRAVGLGEEGQSASTAEAAPTAAATDAASSDRRRPRGGAWRGGGGGAGGGAGGAGGGAAWTSRSRAASQVVGGLARRRLGSRATRGRGRSRAPGRRRGRRARGGLTARRGRAGPGRARGTAMRTWWRWSPSTERRHGSGPSLASPLVVKTGPGLGLLDLDHPVHGHACRSSGAAKTMTSPTATSSTAMGSTTIAEPSCDGRLHRAGRHGLDGEPAGEGAEGERERPR